MESEFVDVLTAAIEASIGLAGFAGIVSAVRRPEDIRRTEAVMLTQIVWLSLGTFLNACIMLSMFSLGFAASDVWMCGSASVAAMTVVGTYMAVNGMRGSIRKSLRANPLNALFWLVPIALSGINLMNVFGVLNLLDTHPEMPFDSGPCVTGWARRTERYRCWTPMPKIQLDHGLILGRGGV